MDYEKLSDFSQGLAGVLVAAFALSVALFGGFVVARAMAPPVQKPIVWNTAAPGVKPDSVYAGSPVSVPAPEPGDSRTGDGVIYFAPTSATLPVLVTRVDAAMPKGAAAGCANTVAMLITVNPQGRVINPAFRNPPDCGMGEGALKAVMNWQFRPGQLDGKASPMGALVDVRFR
jgi:hypothetical protein